MTQPLSRYEFAYIDFSDPKSLLSYAKKLEGHTFRDVLDLGITPEGLLEEKSSYNEVAFKGGVGTLIEERYFGYKANSDAHADFTDAGVELKTTCYDTRADGRYRGVSSVPLTPPAFVVQQNRLSRAIIFRKSERTPYMATIDVDELREYLRDYCGTAAFGGFPAALLDLGEIESLSGQELCRKAEQLGIDLREFAVGD